jgi:hypothetical protein
MYFSAQGAFSSRRRRFLHSVVHSFFFSPSPLAFASPPFFSRNKINFHIQNVLLPTVILDELRGADKSFG